MPTEPMSRVVLADDYLAVREGVRALLPASGYVDVVGAAGDHDELLGALIKDRQTLVGAYRMGSATA